MHALLLLKMLINFFMNNAKILIIAGITIACLDILNIDAMVQPVKNPEGQAVARVIELPFELHERMLFHVMIASLASKGDFSEIPLFVRTWAHVNKDFYYAMNSQAVTQYLIKLFTPCRPIGSWFSAYAEIASRLRTKAVGEWLKARSADNYQPAYVDIKKALITKICFGDCRLALFAIDTVPALGLDKQFLNEALARVLANEKVRRVDLSTVIRRLIEAGADSSRVPNNHPIGAYLKNETTVVSHAWCSI